MARIAIVCLVCLLALPVAAAEPTRELGFFERVWTEGVWGNLEAWLDAGFGQTFESTQSGVEATPEAAGDPGSSSDSGEELEAGLSIIPNG